MLHTQHVQLTQLKRQRALEATRARFRAKEEVEAAARAIITARREQLYEARKIREEAVKQRLREKLLASCGNVALTLDDVLALHPCRRIAAVKRMLQKYWPNDEPVTAQMALDAGCTESDVSWVKYKLEAFK